VLTKRPERIRECLPADWHEPIHFAHVWFGVTVEDQEMAERILAARGAIGFQQRLFVSAEPLLGPLVLERFRHMLDWLIVAGESGPGARRMDAGWVMELSRWAKAAGVPYFFKRWGDGRDTLGPKATWERREVPEVLGGRA